MEDVKVLQKALIRLGFDPGPVDGVVGTRTRAAVFVWRIANGMPAAGDEIERIVAEAAALDRPTYVTGIDISGNNADTTDEGDDDEDMAKVKAAGHSFVIVKSSEGARYRYKAMARLRAAATTAGLDVGHYHFALPHKNPTDPFAEARNWHEHAGGLGWDYLPMFDIEDHRYDTFVAGSATKRDPRKQKALESWCLRLLDQADNLFGEECGVYTGSWYWQGWLGSTKAFAGRKLWLAAYPAKEPKPDAVPPKLGAWKPTIWQYTATGTVPGLEGRFDVNRLYGSP